MRAECQFSKAGQGLFHNGVISDDKNGRFSFVYDCGTSRRFGNWSNDVLNKSISDYKKIAGERLDLLFVSHLRDDHVSHIPVLIKNMDLGNVVLPFIQTSVRLLLAAQIDGIENDGEMISFYSNPVQYFLDCGAEHVYIVNGSENEKYAFETFNNEFFYEPNFFYDPREIIFKGNRSNKNTDYRHGGNAEVWELYGKIYFHVPHYNWEFKVFNPFPECSENRFYGEVNDILQDNNNDFSLILNNKDLIGRLRGIHGDNFKDENSKTKETSLLLRSRPLTRGYIVDKSPLWAYDSNFSEGCKNFYNHGRADTLLMGDTTFTNTVTERTYSYFNLKRCYIPRIVQMGNHGERADCEGMKCKNLWQQMFNEMQFHRCCTITFVASYGLHNSYGYPNFQCLNCQLSTWRGNNSQIELVNEKKDFSYTVFYD